MEEARLTKSTNEHAKEGRVNFVSLWRRLLILAFAVLLAITGSGIMVCITSAPEAKSHTIFLQEAEQQATEVPLASSATQSPNANQPETGLTTTLPSETAIAIPTASATATLTETATETATATASVLPSASVTQNPILPENTLAPTIYYAQSGDSLPVLAVRFGVEADQIGSPLPIAPTGLIPEGQMILINRKDEPVTQPTRLLPDSEVVNSPTAVAFDTDAFLQEAGGFLASYSEFTPVYGQLTAAQIIDRVALEYSIHPRILLTLLEYESGSVYGLPANGTRNRYFMAFDDPEFNSLHRQLTHALSFLNRGYYGWREGTIVMLSFPDGYELRLNGNLNCGTVAVMYYLAQKFNFDAWNNALYGENSVVKLNEKMFGDPWLIAQDYGPLFSPLLTQPELILPFEIGDTWAMTVGPHAAWGLANVHAALDFNPPKDTPGCDLSYSWTVASASGLVVRSENGVVMLDLDGDGNEQTGWNILYLHIATFERVPLGTYVQKGERIGHPSCEGGVSTGTHIHIARKYNGEWIPADGPLPFVMSGWTAKNSSIEFDGWLIKGDQVVTANMSGAACSHIRRTE